MRPRAVIATAADRLRAAGVASPDHDAAELLAHVLDTSRGQLPLIDDVSPDALTAYDALVARRVDREPLQHLTGVAAFRYVELRVGPGVFVPRPETELLAGWAISAIGAIQRVSTGSTTKDPGSTTDQPVMLDLCTGSGAVAKAIADEAPGARVYAVELDEGAHAWAELNLADTEVVLRLGDFADAFDDLIGTVDVITCNPPYVPLEAWESVAAEARDHDPHLALFSGADGLDAIRTLEQRAARLLRPGGVVGFEHADVQGESAPGLFAATGRWSDVRDHRDLAGRPRFTTARLAR